MISMLRHAVACEPSRPIVYLFSAKTEKDIAFRHELGLIARRHPQVRIVIALTQAAGGPQFYAGRIDEKLVRQVVPDPLQCLFYVCGPQAMIEGTKALVARLGVPSSAGPQRGVRGGRGRARAAAPDPDPGTPVPVASMAGPARAGAVRVRLERQRKDGRARERPDACSRRPRPRRWRSRTCAARERAARAKRGWYRATSSAWPTSWRTPTATAGYTFPCVAWAKGDCVLEA